MLWSWALAVVALVLAASGVLKLTDPQPSQPMLVELGLPAGSVAVRGWGLVELLVSVAVLAGGPAAATVALGVAYAAFAVMVAVLRYASPDTSCGCIGRWSAPPTKRHIAINVMGAIIATGCLVTNGSVGTTTTTTPSTIVFWVTAVLGATAVLAALSDTFRRRQA